jgi:hypothetical protein
MRHDYQCSSQYSSCRFLFAWFPDKQADQQIDSGQEQNFMEWLESLVAVFVADGANQMAR